MLIFCKPTVRKQLRSLHLAPSNLRGLQATILVSALALAIISTSFIAIDRLFSSAFPSALVPDVPSDSPYQRLILGLRRHSFSVSAGSWLIVALALYWKGYVRRIWRLNGLDQEWFGLLVRMRGSRARQRLLRSLGVQRNRFQLAKELKMHWKAVHRHITILQQNGLASEVGRTGRRRLYLATSNAERVMKIIDQLEEQEKLRTCLDENSRATQTKVDRMSSKTLA